MEFDSDTVTSDTTLYAKWTAITYTITYNGVDGATFTTANPTSYTIESDAITLNSPEKTGYTFKGWSGSNGTTAQTTVTIAKGSTGAKIYAANWTANTYKVTFNKNADDATGTMTDQTLTYDQSQALTANAFTRNGYTFNGWNTQANGNGTSYENSASVKNLSETQDATVTLYAQWTVNQYTLTFNTDGGSTIADITQDYNTAITAPSDPTKTGYTFNGWSEEIPTTMPAESKTITAQWTAITYTVKFNANADDATGTMTDQTLTYDQSQALTANAFTRSGYTFDGWNTDEDGSAVGYKNSESVINLLSTQDATITLYAQWTLDISLWGETDNYKPEGTSDKPYVISSLDGWNLLANELKEGNKDSYSGKTFKLADDLDLTDTQMEMLEGFEGIFDGDGHTLTVDITSDKEYVAPFSSVNGATIKNLIVKGTITTSTNYSGGIIGKSEGNTTIENCVFAGKLLTSSNAVGGGFVGENTGTLATTNGLYIPEETGLKTGDSATFARDKDNAQTTITRSYYYPDPFGTEQGVQAYIVDADEGITLTLDEESANGLTYDSTIYAGANETITLSITGGGNAQTGYSFKGYKPNAGTLIESGGKYLLSMPNDDVTISESFTANAYTVTFDANGGTGTQMTTQYITYGAAEQPLTANTYTRTGYEFTGWNTLSDGSGISLADKAGIANLTSNLTLYAQWKAITYPITYNLDGGEVAQANPTSYTIEDSFTLNNPAKEGYTFTGWTGTDLTSETQSVTIAKGSTGNREYTANYTENQQEQEQEQQEQEQEQQNQQEQQQQEQEQQEEQQEQEQEQQQETPTAVTLNSLSVSISGSGTLSTKEGEAKTSTYTANVTGIYSDGSSKALTAGDYSLTWTLDKNVSGISISDGILIVSNSALKGEYKLTITASAIQGSAVGYATKNVTIEIYERTKTTNPGAIDSMTPEEKNAVEHLTLTDTEDNKITDLSQIDLTGFDNLETLDLSGLKNLDEADLSQLPESVKEVNLQGTNINSLNLDGSTVERINANGCENLRNVDAEDNESLIELDVSNTNVTVLNVKNCTNLQTLNCSSCDLEAGDLNLEGCTNLVSLNISRNHFGWFDYDESSSMLNYLDCHSQDITDWESKKTFSFTKFFNSGDVTANVL